MLGYNFSRRAPARKVTCLEDIVGEGACAACRGRITKCNIDRPQCSECKKRNTSCIYDFTAYAYSAARPQQRMKRSPMPHRPAPSQARIHKPTPLQAHPDKLSRRPDAASPYEQIFRLLQSRPPEVAIEVFQRIRHGADATSILRHVEDADLLLELTLSKPGLDSLLFGATVGQGPLDQQRQSMWMSGKPNPAQKAEADDPSSPPTVSRWTAINSKMEVEPDP